MGQQLKMLKKSKIACWGKYTQHEMELNKGIEKETKKNCTFFSLV